MSYIDSALEAAHEYKPFVDGLRAVSVITVIGYHAHVPWLPGGFVGVDVFFVISGFLIINIILKELRDGTFTFAAFWSRRALRILPPYLLVILACVAVAPFVLVLPGEYDEFGRQVLWSALMQANHYFLSLQGYFDGSAESKPLLHLWSLAVEEQFYLVAPLAIFAGWWALRRGASRILMGALVAIGMVASLWACVRFTGGGAGKEYAFYLMPLRAWEFMAGGVLFLFVPLLRRMPRILTELAAAAGLAVIIYASMRIEWWMPYPSRLAIMPVAGACALIAAGAARPDCLTARLLALPPMVGIGLISYAWYLWHWPALTFARIYNFGEISVRLDAAMVVLSLLLAIATYFLVDKPIRKWRKRIRGPLNWRPALVGAAACVPAALAGLAYFSHVSPSVAGMIPRGLNPQATERSQTCNLHDRDSVEPCMQASNRKDVVLLVGDSHADSVFRPVNALAERNGKVLATMSSGACIALFDTQIFDPNLETKHNCEEGRKNAAAALASGAVRPTSALLVSNWSLYGTGQFYRLGRPGADAAEDDQKTFFVDRLLHTVDELAGRGARRILIMAPVPTLHREAPACILRSDQYGVDRDARCSVSEAGAQEARRTTMGWLREAVAQREGVRIVDPFDALCAEGTCRPYRDDDSFYIDTNHLSDAGVRMVMESHADDFAWLVGEQQSVLQPDGSVQHRTNAAGTIR